MDFLGVEPNEWYGRQRMAELEKALIINVMRRLMHQTLTKLEREILSARFGQIMET
jgi:hypothetical protein